MKKHIFFQAIKLSQYLCGRKSQPTCTLPGLLGSFNYQDSRGFPYARKTLATQDNNSHLIYYHI